MQHDLCNIEVDQQCGGIHDGGDQRRRHHGRVHMQLFCRHGQQSADELRQQDGADQGQAHHQRHRGGHLVEQQQFCKVAHRQRCAAQQGHPALPPQDAGQVVGLDLAHRHAADDGGGALTARVAAGIGQHGDVRRQHGHGGQCVLIPRMTRLEKVALIIKNSSQGARLLYRSHMLCLK